MPGKEIKMPFDDAQMKKMDEAAEQAEAELREHLDGWSARELAAWWSNWYGKAGHKRLGRILVGIGKKQKEPF